MIIIFVIPRAPTSSRDGTRITSAISPDIIINKYLCCNIAYYNGGGRYKIADKIGFERQEAGDIKIYITGLQLVKRKAD
jgi:hypothetical protein